MLLVHEPTWHVLGAWTQLCEDDLEGINTWQLNLDAKL